MPPITTTDDQQQRTGDRVTIVGERHPLGDAGQKPASETGDRSRQGERPQLHEAGRTVYAAAVVGLSRTARVTRPTGLRRSRPSTATTSASAASTTK